MTVLALAGWYPWCVGGPGKGDRLMGNEETLLCKGGVSTELETLEGTELGLLFLTSRVNFC